MTRWYPGAMARHALLILLCAVQVALARPVPLTSGDLPRPLPQPALPTRTLHLQRVIDPRFPALDEPGWERAKRELTRLMRDLYNLEVRLEDRGVMEPAAYFKMIAVDTSPPKAGLRDQLIAPAPERARFVERVRRSIQGEPPDTVAGYLPGKRDPAVPLPEAIATVYETRANAVLADLGGFEPAALVTMAPWSAAMKLRSAPEVLVTNLPILYGWRDGTALHALVRGGLIGGFATFNGEARFRGGAMVTLAPLVSGTRVIREVGGPKPAPDAAGRAAGALMAHELSHLMFRVGDNYTHDACLMHPPPGLDYFRWWYEAKPVRACAPCNRDARIHEFARLAGELADQGHLDEAVATYAKAVAAAPDRPELLNEAAWFCAERLAGVSAALSWAREGVRLKPDASHILDTLGWLEALAGRPAQAVEALTRAKRAAQRPEPEITYHLAMALLAAGRWAEGGQAARDAIEQGHRPALWKPAKGLWESFAHLLDQGQRFF